MSTAEHVLAALRGLGVDNAVVEIDGPEAPIMDGSAAPFVAAIDQAGIETLGEPRRFIRILKPVRVAVGDACGEFRPYSRGFRVEAEIEFDHPLIGRQTIEYDGRPESFRRDFARARTFGFLRDVSKLWNGGFALGASLENTLVVSDSRVLNPEGARFADEFVRHKVLDAIGDLALAGAPLLGVYRTVRGGHKLNYAALSALMADATRLDDGRGGAGAPGARPCRSDGRSCGRGLRAGRVLTPDFTISPGLILRHIAGGMSAYLLGLAWGYGVFGDWAAVSSGLSGGEPNSS